MAPGEDGAGCEWDADGNGGLGWCRPLLPLPPPQPCASHLDPYLCEIHVGCLYDYTTYACEDRPCFTYSPGYATVPLACPAEPACLAATIGPPLNATVCYGPSADDTFICASLY
jgi:hypothetical protein